MAGAALPPPQRGKSPAPHGVGVVSSFTAFKVRNALVFGALGFLLDVGLFERERAVRGARGVGRPYGSEPLRRTHLSFDRGQLRYQLRLRLLDEVRLTHRMRARARGGVNCVVL